ncbi:MAG TPA: protein kinase [Ktedonosporobacter sp.]|nr:protein kinase [Ktedonosporobacter sp.]
MAYLVGQQLQGYQLTLELDQKASHTLYLGEPVEGTFPKQYIVCKSWHEHRLATVEERERFLGEAQDLQNLQHPYILPIRAYGIQDGYPYLISDYAQKKSLKTLLRRRSPLLLPVPEALTIISQVGLGLATAHQQSRIHGNLKTENVLLNATDEVQLSDFRLASLSERRATTVSPSPHAGTAYMAPEQLIGTVTPESDQFALGAMAYELLTGSLPFQTDAAQTYDDWLLDDSHRADTLIPPREHNPLLPVKIEQALLRAMAKEPTQRYHDMLEFVMALNLPLPPEVSASSQPARPRTNEAPSDAAAQGASRALAVGSSPFRRPDEQAFDPAGLQTRIVAVGPLVKETDRSSDAQQRAGDPPASPEAKADLPPIHESPTIAIDAKESKKDIWWRRLPHSQFTLLGVALLILLISVGTVIFDLTQLSQARANLGTTHIIPTTKSTRPTATVETTPFGQSLIATSTPILPRASTSASVTPGKQAILPATHAPLAPPVVPTAAPAPTAVPTQALPQPPSPTVASTPTVLATPPSCPTTTLPNTPCPANVPTGMVKISFEDGTTDGWVGENQVVTVRNSTQFASDGTHSLQATLHHIASTDYPYILVDSSHLSPVPLAGQTLTMWVYIPDSAARLQSKLLVMDNHFTWYSSAMGALSSGRWNLLTFSIPTTVSSILQIGIQFNSQIPGTVTTDVYIDAVGWA